jgi:nucleoside-diphosphate-sugar epimerase
MTRTLVIGGNRFVGNKLVKSLLSQSYVTVFNRSGTGPTGTIKIKGDRDNIEDLDRIPFEIFDYVIDMCLFNIDQYKLIENYLIESNIKKYVFMSTAAVGFDAFGKYAEHKEQVENSIKNSSLNYLIIRPVYIVGEGSHRSRLGYYFNTISKGMPIDVTGTGEENLNLVHVNDVVNEMIDVIFTTRSNETIIITNGQPISQKEIIDTIRKFLDVKQVELEYVEEGLFLDEPLVFNTHSTNKTLEEMLPDYYKWFQTKGIEKYGY